MSVSRTVDIPGNARDVRSSSLAGALMSSGEARKQAEEATQRLAAIVASSDDAIISKTLSGSITSWNKAAERLFGYTADEIIGQSVLTLIPADRHDEENDIVSRIQRGEHVAPYETVRQHKDGRPIEISLTVSPIQLSDGTIIGASKIARDITRHKRAEALLLRQTHRLATFNRVSRIISRDLDLERIVQSVADIATDLSGAKFGAFFYNAADESGEISQPYAFCGAPREAYETFGLPRATTLFKPASDGFEVVRSDDIRNDPRFEQGGDFPYGMPSGDLPIASFLAVPVVSSSGEVLGGLFFGHDEPGKFEAETETLISAVAGQAAVAMDNARLHKAAQVEIEQRRRAESANELLLNEIKHRVKNTLATVQAIATQTFRKALPQEKSAFVARLQALSAAHDLLTQRNWDTVAVDEIVGRALLPFLEPDHRRIAIGGPETVLQANKALLLAMVLHELGTNAVKYGALSNETGKIELRWELVEASSSRRMKLSWHESGGPTVEPPTRTGFGSRMIERALKGDRGAARFDFPPDGVICVLEMTI